MNAMRHRSKQRSLNVSPRMRRRFIFAAGLVAGVFVLGNAILWGIYRERTYPRTRVMGVTIGSVTYGSLADTVNKQHLLPEKVTLAYGDTKADVALADLGITTNVDRTTESADRQRSKLPIINLFKTPQLQAPITIDDEKLAKKADDLATLFNKSPTDAKLVLTGIAVSIDKAQNGYQLDRNRLEKALATGLDAGKDTISVTVNILAPKVTADDLKDAEKSLEQSIATAITYTYNGQSKQTNSADVAGWMTQSGHIYTPSEAAIQAFITQVGTTFGIRVKDSKQVAAATQEALANKKATSITLTAQIAAKTYTYCTAVKGVDSGQLTTLRAKLKTTYADARGWSVGGLIEYKEVNSGCDFTVWLTAAEQMPTFGAICDSMWSCRVGPNVVLNYTRWTNASPAWNTSGGTIDEYRNMVINHETGHWLGFGHRDCPGPGQAAPVMQQQSINLQGCTFNAWPTTNEITSLRQKIGV